MKFSEVQIELRNRIAEIPFFAGYGVFAELGLSKPDIESSLVANKAVIVVYPPITADLVSQAQGKCVVSAEITASIQLIGNRTVNTVDGVDTENYNFIFDIYSAVNAMVQGVLRSVVDRGDQPFILAENPIQLSVLDAGELAYDITFKKQCVI